MAASALALVRNRDRQQHRRCEQRARISAGRRDHRCPLSRPLCLKDQELGAFRYPGLDRPAEARTQERRRSKRYPRNVWRHPAALRPRAVTAEYDRRLTAARPDLAASHLKGKIAAAAYAEGRTLQVSRGVIGLYASPAEHAGQQTQLLLGENFTVYEEKDGWVWGQAESYGYVGYAWAENFATPQPATHRVIALGTPLLFAPDVKQGTREILPLNAKLSVAATGERFARLSNGFYISAAHLRPLDFAVSDWVSVAERFLEAPYVWGGKTFAGIDCSGLVQTSLEAGGIRAPRDTYMMEAG